MDNSFGFNKNKPQNIFIKKNIMFKAKDRSAKTQSIVCEQAAL